MTDTTKEQRPADPHATGQRNALGTVINCGCARCAATIAEIERQNLGLKIQGV